MVEEFVNRDSFSKHIDIFITKVQIALKENTEYKINLWSAIITNIIYFSVIMIFYTAISPLLEEILGWTIIDFSLYLSMGLLLGKFQGIFTLKFLQRVLLKGDFNSILCKPVNSFFYFSTQFRGMILVTLSIFIMINFILILLYYNLSFLFLFYFLFSIVYTSLFFSLFMSTAFFMKENSLFLNIPRQLNNRIKEFTPKAFENYSFANLIYILPTASTSFILVEFLRENLEYLDIILKIVFPSFIVIVFGTYIMWHFGLKKYEAYG